MADPTSAPMPTATAAAPPPPATAPKIDDLLKGTVDPKDPGYVHYGNLRVEAGLRTDFEAAQRYLAKSPEAVRSLESLEKDPHTTTVKAIGDQNDLYRPSTRTIEWDPKSALITTGGGVQSAALGLMHEQEHANNYNRDPAAYDARHAALDPKYQNGEERRVIAGVETTVATELGEGVRTDHGGTAVHRPTTIDHAPAVSPRAGALDPADAKSAIQGALASGRASGSATGPEPTEVRPWDGKAHTGSIVHIDEHTVAQSLGRGQYQVYDVQRDLHGVMPPANDPNVAISSQGNVQTPQAHALAQSH